ncbi:MAG TPA: DUF2721 domain-containing protein [Gemmataceae bacterium]|nr:DUF2721 domain-containing protein [Gemmataceae bacterium]
MSRKASMQLGILIGEAGLSTDGAHAIQLALAPVFLLTGIAGLLNVMTARLGRIIDRSRHLTEAPQENLALPAHERASELGALERRRHLAGMAIIACTLAALLTCLVIVLLFAEVLLGLPLKWLEGLLFTGATVGLVVGLIYFLREVRIGSRFAGTKPPDTAEPSASPDRGS